jgi:hypothetical protein
MHKYFHFPEKGITMNRLLVFIIILIALYLLAGCGGTMKQMVPFPDQSKVVENQGKGRIYVMGSPSLMNLASHHVTSSVLEGDKIIGYIADHSYLSWEREPGDIKIYSYLGNSTSVVNLSVENGKVYYVLLNMFPAFETIFDVHPGGGNIHAKLEVVDEETGKKELLKCKPPERVDSLQKTSSEPIR